MLEPGCSSSFGLFRVSVIVTSDCSLYVPMLLCLVGSRAFTFEQWPLMLGAYVRSFSPDAAQAGDHVGYDGCVGEL